MRKAQRTTTLLAGLVLLMAALFTSGTAQAGGAPVRIMPLGDSITDGAQIPGGYRIDLWELLLFNGYNIEFVGSLSNGPPQLGSKRHEGHSGWIISQIDERIQGWLDTYQPDIVLLMIGTNDVNRNVDLAHARDRMSGLIDKITDEVPDAVLVVAQIIPIRNAVGDARAKAFNAFIPDLVEEKIGEGRLITYVDMHSALDASEDLIDTLHPNVSGYSKMAHVWYQAVVSILGPAE